MIEIPYTMLSYPLTLSINGKSVLCSSDDDVRVALSSEATFRIREVLKGLSIYNYEEFMTYTGNVIPYLEGIEDLSLMRGYTYPYYYEYEGKIRTADSPTELGQLLVYYYKKGIPVTLLPMGEYDWRVIDYKYPKDFADYMHQKDIKGIDYFFKYTGGLVPYFEGMAVWDRAEVVKCLSETMACKEISYPCTIKFGSSPEWTFDLGRAKDLGSLFIEGYKNHINFEIIGE